MADSTIWEMEQRGEFPLRFALSPRCVVWYLDEVEAWLESRRAKRVQRAFTPEPPARGKTPPDRAQRPQQRR